MSHRPSTLRGTQDTQERSPAFLPRSMLVLGADLVTCCYELSALQAPWEGESLPNSLAHHCYVTQKGSFCYYTDRQTAAMEEKWEISVTS